MTAKTHTAKNSRPADGNGTRRFPLLPAPLVFFICVWLFAGVWYADVFRAAEQYSFFAPDLTLMQHVWDKPYGPLWIAGRALLTLFHYPLAGGAVLALLLTLVSWLTGYNLRLAPRWRPLQYLPAMAYLGALVYGGLDIYYQAETGRIMGIPLCALAALAVPALIIRSFSRKPVPAFFTPPTDEPRRQNLLQNAVCLLAVACPMIYTAQLRPYVRVTARMQCQLDKQDWQGIIATAHDNAALSTRPMAALYAMALTQTGQITERLFDIRYEYEDLGLHNRTGNSDAGSDFFQTDANYYAGLLLAANRNAIEHLTMEGPTLHMLKRLTQIALMNGETEAALKYLHILNRTPFERDFVKRYMPMALHPERVEQDPEMACIRRVEPTQDIFLSMLREPAFLGYNIALTEGRSAEALHNSIAACLYSKLVPDAMKRCQPFTHTTLPRNIGDAMAIYARTDPEILQYFTGNEMTMPRYKAFLQAIAPFADNRLEHAPELFEKYKGYYPYYYYFGNLTAPTHKKDPNETEQKGVN
ncbi:MAG: DUF6057 family protein [Clostridium sp.]|nr:DUF6057 family protein [Clostridium sp.]